MKHLYGKFTQEQMAKVKESLRKSIFFLLVCADERTAPTDIQVDINQSFKGLLLKMGGMNHLLMEQPELVTAMSLLQAAKDEYNKSEFDFQIYKKLILDAGTEVAKLKEV